MTEFTWTYKQNTLKDKSKIHKDIKAVFSWK